MATELLKRVVKDYPDTPWAARAAWELSRGYGVYLVPGYDEAIMDVSNPTPLPNL